MANVNNEKSSKARIKKLILTLALIAVVAVIMKVLDIPIETLFPSETAPQHSQQENSQQTQKFCFHIKLLSGFFFRDDAVKLYHRTAYNTRKIWKNGKEN